MEDESNEAQCLPNELFWSILEHLDPADLCSAALVSHAFCAISQSILFRDVTAPINHVPHLLALLTVVIKYAHLARMVKRVTMLYFQRVSHMTDDLGKDITLLGLALFHMDNLESLELGFLVDPPWEFLCNSKLKLQHFKLHLNTDSSDELLKFLRSQPSITTFYWRGRSKDRWILEPSALPRLRHFAGAPDMAQCMMIGRVVPELTILGAYYNNLTWLQNVESNIERLTAQSEFLRSIMVAFPRVVPSVSSLIMEFQEIPEVLLFVPPWHLSMPEFKNLRSLTIRGTLTNPPFQQLPSPTDSSDSRHPVSSEAVHLEVARVMGKACSLLEKATFPLIGGQMAEYVRIGDVWQRRE